MFFVSVLLGTPKKMLYVSAPTVDKLSATQGIAVNIIYLVEGTSSALR